MVMIHCIFSYANWENNEATANSTMVSMIFQYFMVVNAVWISNNSRIVTDCTSYATTLYVTCHS